MSRYTLLLLLAPLGLHAQVSFERLLNADEEPHNWLTYSGTYASTRYSLLDRITLANVGELELKWVFQAQSLEKFESTPLIVDGIMYLTEAPNTVVALDAATGRAFWDYRHNPSTASRPCCGRVNRGLAMLGNTLFMATIDAQLIAIDAINGQPVWRTEVADPGAGYAMTLAPLVVKDKVIVGVAGGEFGIRGFISAHDAETGEEAWKFYTIPGPGEPGHETWEGDTDAWQHGGASVWLTGSYDPELDQTYWGIGNPGPDWNPAQRPGDNLYSDSVVALDPDTGELEWHFQFTPNDDYDYDAVQIPVLADIDVGSFSSGRQMLWANRNGFFYVLDRTTGEFIRGEPFTDINWASGLGESGRPIETPQPPGRHDLSRSAGRHQLVFAVLQSAHGTLLRLGMGGLRFRFSAAGAGIPGGADVPWRHPGHPRARGTQRTEPAWQPDQQLDRGGRYRCRDRHRPRHG